MNHISAMHNFVMIIDAGSYFKTLWDKVFSGVYLIKLWLFELD